MADAYFSLITGDEVAQTYRSDPATGGPWAPDRQHGGPPNALAVHVAERCAQAETGRDDLIALRLAAEFVGPVPVAPLTVQASVVRAARSGVLVSTTVTGPDGRTCLLGRVWLVRHRDTAAVAQPASGSPGFEPSGPESPRIGTLESLPAMPAAFPYGESIEWRLLRGEGLAGAGPSAVWTRPRRTVVDGETPSGLQRVVLVGDSASGVSAQLDWSRWSFANVDLDVHLARPAAGDWLLLDAVTQLGPTGAALARSTVSDQAGVLGATLQTLVVEPIRDSPPRPGAAAATS